MVDDEKIPAHDVLVDMRLHPLEPGEVAEYAFVLLKVRAADGETSWSYRTSDAPNREELLGALVVQTDLLRRELLGDWE